MNERFQQKEGLDRCVTAMALWTCLRFNLRRQRFLLLGVVYNVFEDEDCSW